MTLLGDSPQRNYTHKLDHFTRYAEPELRAVVASLDMQADAQILDAGCGTGLMSQWLAERMNATGYVVGVDLSHAHVEHAVATTPSTLPLTYYQGDITTLDVPAQSFDGVWCANTIHHLQNPVAALRALCGYIRPGGTLWLGRSHFLPDMFFAWDERLEREITFASYAFYRDKYGLEPRDTADARNYVGWVRAAGFTVISARTISIDRITPLSTHDLAYLHDTMFHGYWRNDRLKPYLSPDDFAELEQLRDPASPQYALRRPEFHHIQTFTLVTAKR